MSGEVAGFLSGAVAPAYRATAANGGWADARTAQRAQRASASPECRERSAASDGPRSVVSKRARFRGSGRGAYRTLHYVAAMVRLPEISRFKGSSSIRGGSA